MPGTIQGYTQVETPQEAYARHCTAQGMAKRTESGREMNLKITRTMLPVHDRYFKFFGFVDYVSSNDWAGLYIQGYGHREIDRNNVIVALAKRKSLIDKSLDTSDRVDSARMNSRYYDRFDEEEGE